ncbi:MAG TPA: phosphatase PAP2 family protein [Streptosporangiaceae bacterium]|nr:phosphatase PAP2 family protein [Streptosporangiaceae bacterium]
MDSTDVRSEPRLAMAPERPLLSPAARPWAAGVLAACAVIVAVLGVLFAHQTRADAFDRAVDAPFISALGDHHETYLLARPGSELPALLICAAIVIVCLLARRLGGALLAALGLAVSEVVTEKVLKPLFHRTYLGSVTYPSGHTTAIFALVSTVAVLLLMPPRPARARPLQYVVLAAAAVLAVVVPVGLLGLRWHYFTDIVGGAAVGLGAVLAIAFMLDVPIVRRWLAAASRRIGRTGS